MKFKTYHVINIFCICFLFTESEIDSDDIIFQSLRANCHPKTFTSYVIVSCRQDTAVKLRMISKSWNHLDIFYVTFEVSKNYEYYNKRQVLSNRKKRIMSSIHVISWKWTEMDTFDRYIVFFFRIVLSPISCKRSQWLTLKSNSKEYM